MNIDTTKRSFFKKILKYSIATYICILINNNVYKTPCMEFVNEKFYAMGTEGKIQLFTENANQGRCTAKEAIRRINELEKVLSKFKAYSDISILNLNPFIENYVCDDTVCILEKSNKYNKLTNGYFNIGLGNYLTLTGIDPNVPLIGKNFFSIKNYEKTLLRIKGNKVILNDSNSMLDLGGIAKGYALDEAMKILNENGIKNAAIEFGGDIKVCGGLPNNDPWNILINIGHKNDYIKLKNGSISVSGGYIKKAIININDITHHIINPKTLKSKNDYLAIAVIGESSTVCDALATACYNMSIEEIKKLQYKNNDYEIKTYT